MNGLTEKIKRTYVGVLPADEPFSATFDSFQIENKCCGVNDYTDLHSATKWNRAFTSTNDTMMIPPSCCKMKPETGQPRNAMCTTDGSDSNKDEPCWDHIELEYKYVLWYVMFALVCEVFILAIVSYDESDDWYIIRGCIWYCVGKCYKRM